MIYFVIFFTIILNGVLPPVHGETDTTPFPFYKTFHPESTPHGEIASFILDEDLLVHTADDFSNLRILDGEGQETPFLMRHRKETETVTTETPVRFTTTSLNILPDNRMEITLEKDERDRDITPEIITLHTPAKNYEKQVSVYSSHNGETWRLITENTPIFDYSRFIDVRNNRIKVPPVTDPFIRIVVTGMSETYESPLKQIVRESHDGEISKVVEKIQLNQIDFRIDRITFSQKNTRDLRTNTVTQSYTVLNLDTIQDPDTGNTIVTFETHRAPVTEIKILTDTSNFHRTCRVDVFRETPQKSYWHNIAAGTISRIRSGSYLQETLILHPRLNQSIKKYRIIIRNNDNPPLNIAGILIRGFVWEGMFFSRPDQKYTIYYGGDRMEAPIYDIAGVIRKSGDIKPDIYVPGEEKPNPGFSTPENPWPMEGKTVLTIVMILMVIILGGVIFATVRKLE